ncbi:MAG: hypothetical protein M1526_04890 [Candidatus Thermoplasmatota archaeon]|jgi:hypothetical protein|nr:hypothetical protein [Candidatus Thermoplasmatota archaeon]MCL5681362.1 hypothetical protein [Candidatus Thermoplasmatota archaeon]
MSEGYQLLREWKLEGEEIIFSTRKGRMMLLSEIWDSSKTSAIEEISRNYGIDSREKFLRLKEEFNLTDY